jgi:hypothetical protein
MTRAMTIGQWRAKYNRIAYDQGWGVFDSSSRGLEIQRIDSLGIFDYDEDAVTYVWRLARKLFAVTLTEQLAAVEALLLTNMNADVLLWDAGVDVERLRREAR